MTARRAGSVLTVDPAELLAVFDIVVEAVRTEVASVADRHASGTRRGQYALDLVADAAALGVLLDAGLRVLSEESGVTGPRPGEEVAPICVALDPVDGSTNASRRIPFFATSLCAVDADGPLAATVANLATGVTYRAVRGGGATRDGDSITVGAPTRLGEAIVGLNGHSRTHLGWRQYRALGSVALELCAIADGGLDAYANFDRDGHGPWDYLGGALVVTEAGGVVVDVEGRDLAVLGHDDRRTVVAASDRALVDEIARLL